jgi:Protein of unknown function (DUF3313)
VAALLAVSACSDDQTNKPSGLSSSGQLAADTKISGAWIYRSPNANFGKYKRVMLDPTVIYGGPEANFKDISVADRQTYAATVDAEMRRVLGEKISLVSAPGPDVVRIHVTLIGVRTTVGGVATVTRVLPIGIAVNAIRGAAGEGGTMTGGIELAVELYDSQTNDLLAGAVRDIAPGAFDLGATMSTNDTVKASASDAATILRDALLRRMGS